MGTDAAAIGASSRVNQTGLRCSNSSSEPYRGAGVASLVLLCVFFVVSIRAQSFEALGDAVRNGNTEQKRTALSTIRGLGTEAAARIAVSALTDRDEIVRSMAAAALVNLPQIEATRLLEPLLGEKSEFVRREAVFALGETSAPAAVSLLEKALEKDRSPLVRAAAAAALGKIGDPSAVDPLIGILRRRPSSSEEYLRRAAARSLGQIAEILRDGRRQTATPQAFLPNKFKHEIGSKPATILAPAFTAATPILLSVAANEREAADTRREAAYALGSIGDTSALTFLQAHINDPDIYLAEICREALLKMPKPE